MKREDRIPAKNTNKKTGPNSDDEEEEEEILEECDDFDDFEAVRSGLLICHYIPLEFERPRKGCFASL